MFELDDTAPITTTAVGGVGTEVFFDNNRKRLVIEKSGDSEIHTEYNYNGAEVSRIVYANGKPVGGFIPGKATLN